jgi:hypothetical protein
VIGKISTGALVLAGCLTVPAAFLLRPFLIMLLLGGVHHEVSSSVPAFSFFAVFLLNICVGLILAPIKALSKP